MKNNPVDVLNLEWTSKPSRDRHMATLVCNYLRYRGYSVREGSIFQGYHPHQTIRARNITLGIFPEFREEIMISGDVFLDIYGIIRIVNQASCSGKHDKPQNSGVDRFRQNELCHLSPIFYFLKVSVFYHERRKIFDSREPVRHRNQLLKYHKTYYDEHGLKPEILDRSAVQ